MLVRRYALQSALFWGTGWGTGLPRLTARKVVTAPPGVYSDDGGLYLCVSSTLTRTWVYRFSWRGGRPEMGLGSVEAGVGLAEARSARDKYRQILRSGRNPIEARQEERRALAKKPTFGELADGFLKTKEHEWATPSTANSGAGA